MCDEVTYQVRENGAGSKMYENGKTDQACLGELSLRFYRVVR